MNDVVNQLFLERKFISVMKKSIKKACSKIEPDLQPFTKYSPQQS